MFIFLMWIASGFTADLSQRTLLFKMMEEAHREVGQEATAMPELYPHYLVYGLEGEASVGIGDVLEAGSSLGVELHYERVEP